MASAPGQTEFLILYRPGISAPGVEAGAAAAAACPFESTAAAARQRLLVFRIGHHIFL
jgi:hypothetical protein